MPFQFLSEYFWLLLLAFGAFNYLMARKGLCKLDHGTQAEAATYLNRLAIGINLPWIVMGIGQLTGFTPTVWHYFRPQDGNPFVIAWLAVITVMTCIYAWWILFSGGAEKVRDLNLMALLGHYSSRPQPLLLIKLFAVAAPLFIPVWIYFVIAMDAPLPM